MTAIEIADDIFWIGVNLATRDLFEGIWPIPDGVSINSYLVKGTDKIALIDLAYAKSYDEVLQQLEATGVDPAKIDYVIMNHLEPDHSGMIRSVHTLAPQVKFVGTKLAVRLAKAFYDVDDAHLQEVKSGDAIDLGGKTLAFEPIPNVHWPDTMVTYETSTQTLFTCDAFGSFGALKGAIFADEICECDRDFYERETLRYFANIVAAYCPFVLKAIDKLGGLDIKIIAPSHGLLWRETDKPWGNPSDIVNEYVKLANYDKGARTKPKIAVVWGSMYGNTEKMMRAIVRGIAREGVAVEIFRVPETDVSYILSAIWESAGLVFGAPTYEAKAFPPMAYVWDVLSRKHVFDRKVLCFGSYGWSKGAQKQYEELTGHLKWETTAWLEFNGAPGTDQVEKGEAAGQALARLVKDFTSGE